MSYTSTEVKARWNRNHYDRMSALIPKGRKELLKKYCEEKGVSMNCLITNLLLEAMRETDLIDRT